MKPSSASGYVPMLRDRHESDDSSAPSSKAVTPRVVEEHKGIMLVPGGDIPQDSILSVTAISSVFDLEPFVDVVEPVILSIGSTEIIRCALAFPGLFGGRYFVLEGVPGFEYTSAFSEATWGLDRLSYASLSADVQYARDMNERAQLASETVHEKERRRTQRKSGHVKAFEDFEVAQIPGRSKKPEVSEEAEESSDE